MPKKVQIDLIANDKATKNMKKVSASADRMGANFKRAGKLMTGAGLAVVGSVGLMVNKYAKAGDEVAKMAKRTGFAVETLSELRYAAELSGSSIESIEKGIKRMASTVYDAEKGLSTATDALADLGLSAEDLKGKKPEEQFWTLANALAEVEDASIKSALAQRIFGRAGTEMLPMLLEGKAGIDEMRKAAQDLNLVFDEDSAKAAEAFEDAKTQLKGSLMGIAGVIGENVMPQITELLNAVGTKMKVAFEWLGKHPELLNFLLKMGGVLTGLMLAGGPILLAIAGIRSLTIALAALQAISGIGLGKLVAGIGIAAAVAYGIYELTKIRTPAATSQPLPKMHSGGIVPGVGGEEVPIMARAGEKISGRGMGGGIIVNIYGNLMTEDDALNKIREGLLEVGERNTTTGIV